MHEHERCEHSVLNPVTWQLRPLKMLLLSSTRKEEVSGFTCLQSDVMKTEVCVLWPWDVLSAGRWEQNNRCAKFPFSSRLISAFPALRLGAWRYLHEQGAFACLSVRKAKLFLNILQKQYKIGETEVNVRGFHCLSEVADVHKPLFLAEPPPEALRDALMDQLVDLGLWILTNRPSSTN